MVLKIFTDVGIFIEPFDMIFLKTSADPIPDNSRIFGLPNTPAERMTSFLILAIYEEILTWNLTPVAIKFF